MNRALFRTMIKQNGKKIAKFSTGIILYELLLTGVYPAISKNTAITEIADSIPSAVKSVFGVSEDARTDTFEAFISAQFFARIYAMLMILYNVNTANELLAKMADDGSLAFILATPVPRDEILTTQALVLLFGNALMTQATLLGLLHGSRRFEIPIDESKYLSFGFLSFTFFSFIGLYSLFLSALFAKSEISFSIAAGLTLAFYALDVAGGLSDNFSWVRKFSLFQCYRPQEALEGTEKSFWKITGLTIGSYILLKLGIRAFNEKDLPL
ncbi:MAG: ABC transporter permease subunit [Desulfitobacterium sp.]|nr:ABC transporter permease subunit [Desulfitobacterium sp.]